MNTFKSILRMVLAVSFFAVFGAEVNGAQNSESSYTLVVPHGISTIANHLDHGENKVAEVLPSVPEGTLLYKFIPSPDGAAGKKNPDGTYPYGMTVNQFQFGTWLRPNETLAPGEGAFIRNPGDSFSIKFTGTKPAAAEVLELYRWITLISFPEPGVTQLPPPSPGDTIWRFDVPSQNLIPSVFDDLANTWFVGGGPPATVDESLGKSFFYQANDPNLPLPPSSQEPVSVGTIYFSTRVPQAGVPRESKSSNFIEEYWQAVDARVTWEDGTGIGQGFTAQLYGGPDGTPIDQLVPLTPTTTFQTESAAMRGYVKPVLTSVPDASAGRSVTLVMRVFDGESYETSVVRAESNPITIRSGGGIFLPASLVGLEGFSIAAPVGARRTIGVERTPTGFKLRFAGTLQSAAAVTGPYSDVAEAGSPANILFSETAKFYRLKPGE